MRILSAQLYELSAINQYLLAALVGIVPFNRDSYLTWGRRSIQGGRVAVRGVLHMAALTDIRRSFPFRPCYEQLIRRDRPMKAAFVAGMRILLVALNAIVRDRTPWRPITRPSTQPLLRVDAAV